MKICRLLSVLFACASLAVIAHAVPDKEVLGREAADAWLKLIDAEKYAESWKACAPIFRDGITEKKWVEAMDMVRKPLGKIESRKLKAAIYTQSLPEAPPGEYVVIQYETKFANREEPALETITPMYVKAEDKWMVSGYYIK